MQFLRRVNLIDTVHVARQESGTIAVELETPQLGRQRFSDNVIVELKDDSTERLSVRWFHNGNERDDLNDTFNWQLSGEEAQGEWRVVVRLHTEEIRHDPSAHTTDEYIFTI